MIVRPFAVIVACCVLLASSAARAQSPDWLAGPLDNGQAPNGIPGTVEAWALWDPDGAGPLPEMLVAAGDFTAAEGVPANNIAARDPVTGKWQALGSGTNDQIRALAVYNGELYAGGLFTSAGGQPGTSYIARWNGSTWQSVGFGTNGDVYALTVLNGVLFAGGYFNSAGGSLATSHVAAWDGTSWQGLGSGANDYVLSLYQYAGTLIAGGYFITIGGVPANHIAQWNGSSWQALGTGVDAEVIGLGLYNGDLVAGGRFTHAGGNVANRVARWNGSSWQTYGAGLNSTAIVFATYNNELVVGGAFTMAGGVTARFIAHWNGSSWQPMGQGMNGGVYALIFYNGEVAAGGNFTTAGFGLASSVARWNGYDWAPFGAGNAFGVFAMINYVGRVVAGGGFHESVVSGAAAHNILAWDGVSLASLGTGMDNPVTALMTFKYSGVRGSNELIAGGSFTHAGGVSANRIARWDENPFVAFPLPHWEVMGGGFNDIVYAIERFNSETYAGGNFTSPQSDIAHWNETTDTWEALGSGMNGPVYALKAYGGYLYAGGAFTTAGGASTGGLARWNGSSWSQVGGFFLGTVNALEIHNNQLVMAGTFPGINSSPNLAQYNGSFYSTFGIGGTDQTVRSLHSTGSRLYVGGDFNSVGGVASSFIAYWDGVWHAAPNGVDAKVLALTSFHGEEHAGGYMATIHGLTVPSPRWARYTPTGLPWIAFQPASQTVPPGTDATLRCEPAAGYTGLSWQWYRGGVALADGLTRSGSTISGAHDKALTVTNVSTLDNGNYTAVLSNGVGTDTSVPASISVTGSTGVSPGFAGATVLEALGPNPSRGPTQLSFSLAEEAQVRVKIHDVAGRLVRLVEVGHLPPGRHQATWDVRGNDGQRVWPGLYFVGLEVSGRSLGCRRVVILR